MARVQWLVVGMAWLVLGAVVVRAQVRRRRHDHWVAAYDALRRATSSAGTAP